MFNGCAPGSIAHVNPSPIGKLVPGGSRPVSSPGISPRLQTERARGSVAPAPCTTIHVSEQIAMMAIVTTAGRVVAFSSW
jgi:hypothetical protein